MEEELEKTYLMIKPEMVKAGKQGEIIEFIQRNGFLVTKMKQFRFDAESAGEFYGVHREKPFFNDLVQYITSGEVVGLRLEKENAIKLVRELVGTTDPANASPGTIRYMYGASLQTNAVHASDSPESVEKELAIVFPED